MAAPTYDSQAWEMVANFVKANVSKAIVPTGTQIDQPNDSYTLPSLPRDRLTSGTGAGNFNCFSDLKGASATATTSYDLQSIVDPLTNTLTFDIVKYIVILNWATTAGYKLLWDGTVSNAFAYPFNSIATGKIAIPPGWTDGTLIYPGRLILGGGSAAGMVVDATHKVVTLDAGANTIAHSLFVVGVDT